MAPPPAEWPESADARAVEVAGEERDVAARRGERVEHLAGVARLVAGAGEAESGWRARP